ncbi:MAG TPA: FAD-dependent oxidoreductase [Acidimicrobiales bacterium]|nr:FAD-dependent oxidoreductase [Acidimicrobiales bacterium]
MTVNGRVSFWQSSLGDPPRRPALPGSTETDVCIVGAGYTGLWTAWALRRLRPELRVVIVEAVRAGWGASGRNGGWLSGLLPGDRARLAAGSARGRAGVVAMQRALHAAVDEVIAVCRDEGIDADITKGGTLSVATNEAQLRRLRAGLVADREWGVGPDDAWPLTAAEVRARVEVAGAVGGRYSPHCARIQPAKLARGLADAVERAGAELYEATPALSLAPHLVVTPAGVVSARWVVRATEGFTARLPGLRRALLPMNSSMVVTAPLEPATWAELGWEGQETLSTAAHAYLYAQRTADGRIAIGGRGVPYRWGSRPDHDGATPEATIAQLRRSLARLWPAAAGVPVEHAWRGVLGVARDWCPSVGADPAQGLAWAGGYVGDGVTTSHLAGRTIAELVAGERTERTALPWVGHRSPAWEPEPWRWAGVTGVHALYRAADRAEARGGRRTSPLAALAEAVSGRH